MPAIQTLTRILGSTTNQEILSDICWAFSYVTDDGGDEKIVPFVNANTVQVLLQLLNHPNNLISVPSLRILGNLLTASDPIVTRILTQEVLQTFYILLDHPKKVIQKEICWTISNITAGSQE